MLSKDKLQPLDLGKLIYIIPILTTLILHTVRLKENLDYKSYNSLASEENEYIDLI